MDVQTARFLSEMTSDFYRRFGASFSQTRRAAWPGWERCLQLAGEALPDDRPTELLDLACGNLRFEAFLAEALPGRAIEAWAVDDCEALVREGSQPAAGEGAPAAPTAPGAASTAVGLHFQRLDVPGLLLAGESLPAALEAPVCDLSVCFAFLHHLPLPEQRAAVLEALVEKTRPGGCVAVSFWRFLDDEDFAAKVRAEHEQAARELELPPLDEGDRVLGWQGEPGAHRYCHSFSEREIDELADVVAPRAEEVARFRADGRNGRMNSYLVLRRRELRPS